MQNPQVILTGSMVAQEGCASIADANGNLLFYTDGSTIYDQTHAAMANGTGLAGYFSTSQAAAIVKQPGSNTIYFVFTMGAAGSGTFAYSVVDMSLASGNGSVVTKNVALATLMSEKLTTANHCNGVDVWVVAHDTYTGNFRAFQVTSAGVNTTAVVSSAGGTGTIGYMKISPNGKKILCANFSGSSELYDFDASTGTVSNFMSLSFNSGAYGVEFSPDGTKAYISTPSQIKQYDLCAGSSTAIIASAYTITASSNYAMQLATDGKIYVARYLQTSLGVINNPNSSGSGCNYVDNGLSISPNQCRLGLPNFSAGGLRPPPPPFTYTVSNSFGCQTAAFASPTVVTTSSMIGCAASGYSLTGIVWNFGDPASGSGNISTATNPVHAFTALGSYAVKLMIYYSCGGGTDSVQLPVNINLPCISVNSTSITCANLGSATVTANGGIGPYSYTWMPSNQSGSVAINLSPGIYTLTVHDFGNNFTYTATTVFTSLIPLTGNINSSSSITCNGAATGTGNVTNITGGSGSQNYLWTNGPVSYTTPTVNTLSAGLWSATVTDALTGCQINNIFLILQPPAMNLSLSANTPTACAGSSIVLTGTNSGGTPGYTYQWIGGPTTNTRVATQALAGTYIYTLNSKDSYSCSINNTISLDFIPNPTLSVGNVSICPLEIGTLTATGASSYTWNNTFVGNTFTANPLVATSYSVMGSAQSCTSSTSASIILKPLPVPLISSNGPVCNGQVLNFYANGGATYYWTGPLSFTSNLPFPSVNPAAPNNTGTYNMTVTAANSCTASTSINVTVNPTPTVSATGNTVCVNQFLTLSSSSFPGSTFQWFGPNSISSNVQNPNLGYQPVSSSGLYTVIATGPVGCTNSAVADVTITAVPLPIFTSNSPQCFGSTLNFTGNGGGAYSWSGPNGFSSALQNPQISNVTVPAAGNYILTVTIGPCVNSISHSVTINPLPSFTLTSNSPVCETKSLVLQSGYVNNALTYHWQGPGFSSQYQNSGRDSCKITFSGIYKLTVIDSNTCQNSFTANVVINHNPTITTSGATVCLNTPAVLKASGAVSYLWYGPDFYQSATSNAFVPGATSSVVTVYTVVGAAANTCTSVVTASLTTLALPVPSLRILPATRVCLNKTLSFEGFGGFSYEWRGPDNIFFTGQLVELKANSIWYSGNYTLTVIDLNGCKSYTNTFIQVDALPQGNLRGSKMEGCVPLCSDFSFEPSLGSSPNVKTSWIVNGKGYAANSFSFCFYQSGDHSIQGTFIDTLTSCINTSTFTVSVYPLPTADFEQLTIPAVENEEVFFVDKSQGEGINYWSWFFFKTDSSSRQNPSFMYKETGVYPLALTVKNSWGCADTLVKLIKVDPELNIFIPNAFTPNEDGLNDVFLPVLRGIKSYNLFIFNRWGQKIFSTSDTNQGWDGTYSGEICKSDVYIWKIYISAINGKEKNLTGTVILNR
jgi:gliding motility-associated-like protein